MTSSRHDQAAPLRTSGLTDSSATGSARPGQFERNGAARPPSCTVSGRHRRYPERRVARRRADERPTTRPDPSEAAPRQYWWVRWVVIASPSWCSPSRLVLVLGSAGQGVEEPAVGELVVVLAAVPPRWPSMHSFAQIQRTLLRLGQGAGAAVALRGRVLRRQRVVDHAARRPGALGHLRLPPAAAGARRRWWRPGSW